MIADTDAAKRLAELGHGTRLAIFRLLVKGNEQGLTVGEVQQHLDIPGSTLSHHISRLMAAGLVTQERQGRELHCRAKLEAVDELMEYLKAECCTIC
ncbi:ArsR/SmtB family transcription factor [Ferrimonas aestuarii]|uniref:Helix-turn-helix transcriptional regulator n=1 Tax=Ferrimonas aestuarii TaxID=2569539 RepID=A0A4U1BQS5_9GAMM|nr:metalloregulator ArsR/SmtB family transcription factor [Ferrimonas aestuarii]TKB56525.1 helix-turn-helix transcriptional regulator [Ferrimonas aestuarii]